MANYQQQSLASDLRVVIRDSEWIISKVDTASDGGQQLTRHGITESAQDKTSLFLTKLQDKIQMLNPAETTLVQTSLSGYSNTLLYTESQLRSHSIYEEQIHIAHQGTMDLIPYQLELAIQAQKQPRQGILIADAIGWGKALEAGLTG